jgi:hypothetical protein
LPLVILHAGITMLSGTYQTASEEEEEEEEEE